MFSEAGSPLETQINFAYRLSKSFSKPISLSEIARSSWQRRSEGVVTISFFEGKEVDSSDFAERIFKNITVLVTNCSGNIHTDEIFFTSTVILWYQIGLENIFLFGNCKGKSNYKSKISHSSGCHSCVLILKIL